MFWKDVDRQHQAVAFYRPPRLGCGCPDILRSADNHFSSVLLILLALFFFASLEMDGRARSRKNQEGGYIFLLAGMDE